MVSRSSRTGKSLAVVDIEPYQLKNITECVREEHRSVRVIEHFAGVTLENDFVQVTINLEGANHQPGRKNKWEAMHPAGRKSKPTGSL